MGDDSSYRGAKRLALTGVAEVLLARPRPGSLERPVVIKRLLPHVRSQSEFVEVYFREAERALELAHPNAADLIEVDPREGAVVMEYVSGECVDGVIGQAEHGLIIPIGIACRIVADAAAALHAAHVLSPPLLHRDVRPTNLFVSYEGRVKVVDFGVARANLDNTFTRPGTLRMHHAYAPPERLAGLTYDANSDVYSLGVTLWELLAGQRLHVGVSPADVVRSVLEKEIAPPSRFNRAVPSELDSLVLAALRRAPDARIQTADRMRAELEAILELLSLRVDEARVGAWLRAVLADQLEQRRAVERSLMEDEAAPESPSAPVRPRPPTAPVSSLPRDVEVPRSRWLLIAVFFLLLGVCVLAAIDLVQGPVFGEQSAQ